MMVTMMLMMMLTQTDPPVRWPEVGQAIHHNPDRLFRVAPCDSLSSIQARLQTSGQSRLLALVLALDQQGIYLQLQPAAGVCPHHISLCLADRQDLLQVTTEGCMQGCLRLPC